MLYFVFLVIISVIFTEACTELLCKSVIFQPVRERLSRVSGFIAEMLKCGYCTSVWISLIPSFFLCIENKFFGNFLSGLIYLFFIWIVIHRLSNYLHNFNDKFLDKFYDSRFKNS